MSKNPQTAESCINGWIQWHTKYGTLPKTIRGYKSIAGLIVKTFREMGLTDLPYRWKDADVLAIRKYWADEGLSVKTKKGYYFVLTAFAKHYGNDVGERNKMRWEYDPRPNVKWLTLDQVRVVMATPMTEMEAMCIHFMLCMGLRRVEVIRAKLKDIHPDGEYPYVFVDGKGHKRRKVPFNWSTADVLGKWMKRRAELVKLGQKKATHKHKHFVDSDNLIVYERNGEIHPYSELHPNGFDAAVVTSVSIRCHIPFSNHTLRRTFGRELYYKDVDPIDIVTLSNLYGHESINQTKAYIGPDPRRMAQGILKTAY